MTRWVAIFEDNPEEQAGWVRKRHADDHFAYLKMHTDTIKLGLRKSYRLYVWGRAPFYEAVILDQNANSARAAVR